ncbi:Hexosyltransferase [Quillaja saponaria]|uniref:Hexosyltransferase n=1 Tax=Quillaja saponaria TaxID=32244 RepID=A0AAD7VJL8_QUISA|nr:Hexosyltransferase [Quillaja saponaria]
MASSNKPSSAYSSSKPKYFLLCLLFVSLPILLLVLSLKPKLNSSNRIEITDWFDLVRKEINGRKMKVGLVNFERSISSSKYFRVLQETEIVTVNCNRVDEKLTWNDIYPEWIDENKKWISPTCPEVPMPRLEDYRDLDVVFARIPCNENYGKGERGIRDVFSLQVNLVVGNLVVESGWVKPDVDRTVYVVFVGSCGPMVEIFRCDDLLMHQGEYWVYKPELRRLKQKMLMPVGSCQLAPNYAETGREVWRKFMSKTTLREHNYTTFSQRLAYATVLHSSEAYVCGAIALAHSIRQSKSTIDLLLLADDSITNKSIRGLRAAGWKISRIERILSPFAKKGTYNEWNYSKLNIWKLTDYDKVIFIDADFLVLKNIDQFFYYPQLSASPNDNTLFNSGLMVIEPSKCMFDELMEKRFSVKSYNGGDQGFLNEIFIWWHRLPSKLNFLKIFESNDKNIHHEIPEDVYTIHYLGVKPWFCYKDYDCNWDKFHTEFASDSAYKRWWKVYEAMPKKLQSYCGLTKKMDSSIRKWIRGVARNACLSDGNCKKIEVKDPRQKHILYE